MSFDDIRPVALRAVLCLPKYPGLRWLRSYYDPERHHSTCYYETERPDLIWEHSAAAMIPCDAVAEVLEVTPDSIE